MLRITYIRDAAAEPGSMLKIGGRVIRISEVKIGRFIWVRDITGTIQITAIKEKAGERVMGVANSLSPNDFVVVDGKVPEKRESKQYPELLPESISIVGKALEPSPIDIEGHTETNFDKRLDWRALDLRNQSQTAVFLVESAVLEGMHRYLSSHGFMQVFTPSLMGMPSEGGSEVFSLQHFGKTAYLRQDPQLHRQLLMLAGFEKIYEVGPSWRAEQSNTPRHLTEHRTCAAELSFIKDERDVVRAEQNMALAAVKNVLKRCGEELKTLGVELVAPRVPFPVLKFPKVYDILGELGVSVERGSDYGRSGEEALGKYVKEKYGSDFFFVDRFPFAVKPFYVMRVDESPQWARSIDLIYKGMELSSGGQREHRYEKIVEQIREKGLEAEKLEWFTNFFKYGAPPHGGFSLGIERFTAQLLNLASVKEAAAFPRSPDRLLP